MMTGLSVMPGEHRFVAYNDASDVFNTTTIAYEPWNDSNFAHYGIPAQQLGSSGRWVAQAPSGARRYELRMWTGDIASSYPVWEDDLDVKSVISDLTGTGPWTLTVTVLANGQPVQGSNVRLVNTNGTTAARPASTNPEGKTTAGLANGTYTLVVTAPAMLGHTQQVTINQADQEVTVNLSSLVIPSVEPYQTVGYLTAFDSVGNIAPNVPFNFRLVKAPADLPEGTSYDFDPFTVYANDQGILMVTLLRGATYQFSRTRGKSVLVDIPTNAESFALPEIEGR